VAQSIGPEFKPQYHKKKKKKKASVAKYSMPPALRRQRQEDCKFETNLNYKTRPCLRKKKQKITNQAGV
jgi:hypothetical protein